jgi:hypothetical protein
MISTVEKSNSIETEELQSRRCGVTLAHANRAVSCNANGTSNKLNLIFNVGICRYTYLKVA